MIYTENELNRKYVLNINTYKGGLKIANEIIFTELKSNRVLLKDLAATLGLSELTLTQVLRFELEEKEQLNMLLMINNLSLN